MTAFSDIFETALLDHIFHYDVYTYPRTAMVVALWIGDPTDTGSGGAEVSAAGYTRLETTPSDWTAAVVGSLANGATLTFPVALADWGEVTHFALFNTYGDMLFHGPLTSPQTITTGQVAVFVPLGLVIALD